MFDHGWRDRYGALRGDADRSAWFRVTGQRGDMTAGEGQIGVDYDRTILHFGADVARFSTDGEDDLLIGLMGGYGSQDAHAKSDVTGYSSNAHIKGWGLGVYATWMQHGFNQRGWYADAWGMFGKYDADVSSRGFAKQEYDIDSTTLSIEGGYSFDVAKHGSTVFWVEPQAQLIWNNTDMDGFTDESGSRIGGGGDSLTSRLGVRAAFTTDPQGMKDGSTGFVQLDWLHAIERPEMTFDIYTASFGGEDALRVGAGYEYNFSDKGRVGGKIDYTNTKGGDDNVAASLNVNFKF